MFFRDKRVHRHTFGVFLLCWPCGVVVSFDELFGSEGKLQVTYLNSIQSNWVLSPVYLLIMNKLSCILGLCNLDGMVSWTCTYSQERGHV